MTVRLNTVSAKELKSIFTDSELTALVELGKECHLWQDETGFDAKLSSLFSRVQVKAGMTLPKHLQIQQKMFPISQHPSVWVELIKGPVQKTPWIKHPVEIGKELLAAEQLAAETAPGLTKEEPKQEGGTSKWYHFLVSAITNGFHSLVSAWMSWWRRS